MTSKEKTLDSASKQLNEGEVGVMQDLVYCYYAGAGYSHGAVLKMSDNKNYKCDTKNNQGQWLVIDETQP